MPVLREVLERAQADGKAVAHFNVCDLVLLRAVFSAAQELKAPVIVGASGIVLRAEHPCHPGGDRGRQSHQSRHSRRGGDR